MDNAQNLPKTRNLKAKKKKNNKLEERISFK